MARQKLAATAIDETEGFVDELPPGTKLMNGQYTITRFLNNGGFGITYLAKNSLNRDVVIKECFPRSLSRRSRTVVSARSRAHTAELRDVVQNFLKEAHSLAKMVHPNIVAVHQVFEDHGTAYIVIDYIDGFDLQQVIDGEGPPLSPSDIVKVTEGLLGAVGYIHDNDMLHRDISPDNVLIDKTGTPILIDFGAAREEVSQGTRKLSALRVVKDGYSPQEFYIAGSEQGAWSDLYALGATLYHLISGQAPVNGQARLAALAEDRPDPYLPLTGRIDGYPDGFLEAIDQAMNTLPKLRLQSAAEWLARINAPTKSGAPRPAVAPVAAPVKAAEPVAPSASVAAAPADSVRAVPVKMIAGIAAALVVLAVGVALIPGGKEPAPVAEASSASGDAPAAQASETASAPAAPRPAAAEIAAQEAALDAEGMELPFDAPAGAPLADQVAVSLWDVKMPFAEGNRLAGGKTVAVITEVAPDADLTVAGDWIAPGATIQAVNGAPIGDKGSVAGALLGAAQVDPDGKIRAVVDYVTSATGKRTGLLTVDAVRMVNLANGVSLAVSNQQGEWTAVVTGVDRPSETDLMVGDQLYREQTTKLRFDAPEATETVMAKLVADGATVAKLSVLRDGKLTLAAIKLAVE